MKSSLCIALLLLTAGIQTAFAQDEGQAQPQQLQVGRYQILDASFSGFPDAPMKQFKRLVILDTATGALTSCDYVYRDAGKAKDGREYWAAQGGCGPFAMQEPMYSPKASKKK